MTYISLEKEKKKKEKFQSEKKNTTLLTLKHVFKKNVFLVTGGGAPYFITNHDKMADGGEA